MKRLESSIPLEFSSHLKTGPSKNRQIKSLSIIIDNSLRENGLYSHTKVDACTWVEKSKRIYKPGMVLCLDDGDDIPSFRIVRFICKLDDNIFFILKKLTTIFFNQYYAFKVIDEPEEHCVKNYKNLVNACPMALVKQKNCKFLIIRSYCQS